MTVQSSPNADIWHCKQAAMLLHFTSLEYIKGLHKLINDLINGFVDPLLELAESQGRDAVLINPVWGTRDTSANWGNNAWPILKDLQAALAKDVALRSAGRFERTAVNECLRGIDQFSLDWTSPDEERILTMALQLLSVQAGKLDDTLSAANDNRWSDYGFAYCYPSFAAQQNRIPKFRIRTDIVCETGSLAAKTGVYISKDDPHAAVQFICGGANGTPLRNAKTFSDIGLSALNYVGRDELWFNFNKMFDFATLKQYDPVFHNWVFVDGLPRPDLAPSAVARHAFIEQPQKWHLLEPIDGEFHDLVSSPLPRLDDKTRHRIVGGEKCAIGGFYFTPSMMNSRRLFSPGEVTPAFDAKYGKTIWQWDANQE